jgi:nucleoside-diphosphate-sugar epimerase
VSGGRVRWNVLANLAGGVWTSLISLICEPNGQPRRRLDISRAARELGFHATTRLKDGLRRTVDAYLAQKNRSESSSS